MSKSKSIQKSVQSPAPLATPAQAPAAANALPDAQGEADSLQTLADRIVATLRALEGANPGQVRAGCLAVEADLLRLGIRAVNVRGTVAALGQAAYMAELNALAGEVRS